MRYTRLAVALLALAVLRAAECAAQPPFWVTAPGCEQSTGFNVIHGNLLVTGATVACEYDATTLALVRTIPLPAPATNTRVIEAPGDDFLLAGSSPTMHLIDGPTGGVVQTYVDPTPGGNFGWDIGLSGTHVLATDPLDNEVHVFDLATGAFQHTIAFSEVQFGYAIAVLGPDVIVASMTGAATRLRRYDVATGAFLGQFALVPGGPNDAGKIAGRMSVAGADVLIGMPGNGPAAYLLDGTTGAVVRSFPAPEPLSGFGHSARATATEVVVYAAGSPRDVTFVFDRATGTLLRTIRDFWANSNSNVREHLVLLGSRTIAGNTVMAYCGGNAGCGPCETCGPSGSCVAAPHPTCQQMDPSGAFKLMFLNTAARDTAQWKGKGMLAPGGPPDTGYAYRLFGAPDVDTDYALCVFDPSSALLFRAEAPAGTCDASPCWKRRGEDFETVGVFTYRDPDRTPDGIRGARLFRRTDTGLTSLQMRGGGPNLSSRPFGIPTLPLTLPVRVQLQSRDGQCFETTHSTVVSNSTERFVSKSD